MAQAPPPIDRQPCPLSIILCRLIGNAPQTTRQALQAQNGFRTGRSRRSGPRRTPAGSAALINEMYRGRSTPLEVVIDTRQTEASFPQGDPLCRRARPTEARRAAHNLRALGRNDKDIGILDGLLRAVKSTVDLALCLWIGVLFREIA